MNDVRRLWAGPRVLMAVALVSSGLLTPEAAYAQEPPDLMEAVSYYHQHATSDLRRIQEATARLEAVAVANPVAEDPEGGWLPAYWTAFAYTQLSLFARDARSGPYLDLARIYFDRAREAKPEGEPRFDADFLALEGLLLGFEGRGHPDQQDHYRERSEEAWAEAKRVDPENPMALMNEGLGLLPNEDMRGEAYEILDRAIELYEPRMDSALPNWGREFIDVWMGNYPRPSRQLQGSASGRPVMDLSGLGADEWTVRMDREGAGDRPRLTRSEDGFRVLTGGAAILYPESEPLSPPYRVVLDVALFDPAGRNEGYGIVFGGSHLANPDIRYGYYLMRQDGLVLVKARTGQETAVVRDWTRAPALTTWSDRNDGSDRVTNTLMMEVGEDGRVRFSTNGEEIHALEPGEMEVAGRVGLRVNHGVHIEVTGFRVDRLTAEHQ